MHLEDEDVVLNAHGGSIVLSAGGVERARVAPDGTGSGLFATSSGIPLSYLDTDGTLAADSDTKVASQKAVKTYVDANAGGLPTATLAGTKARYDGTAWRARGPYEVYIEDYGGAADYNGTTGTDNAAALAAAATVINFFT